MKEAEATTPPAQTIASGAKRKRRPGALLGSPAGASRKISVRLPEKPCGVIEYRSGP